MNDEQEYQMRSPKKWNTKSILKKFKKESKKTRMMILLLFLAIVSIVIAILVFCILSWINTNQLNGNFLVSFNTMAKDKLDIKHLNSLKTPNIIIPKPKEVLLESQNSKTGEKEEEEKKLVEQKIEEKKPEIFKFKSLIV